MSSKMDASLVEAGAEEGEHSREQCEKPEVYGSMVLPERTGDGTGVGEGSGRGEVEGWRSHSKRKGWRCASRLNQEAPAAILKCALHPEGTGIHQVVLNREGHGQTCIFKRSLWQQA